MKNTRRFISGLSALALAISAMSISAFAAPEPTVIDQTTPEPKQGEVVITTEIAPTYIVTIPADTTVAFNDLTTDFGEVELTQARLDPGKQVVVSVDTDGCGRRYRREHHCADPSAALHVRGGRGRKY